MLETLKYFIEEVQPGGSANEAGRSFAFSPPVWHQEAWRSHLPLITTLLDPREVNNLTAFYFTLNLITARHSAILTTERDDLLLKLMPTIDTALEHGRELEDMFKDTRSVS